VYQKGGAMADIDFEVHGKPGEIAVHTYRNAMDLAFGVLSDLDAGITGVRYGGLRWYIRTVEQRASSGIFLRVYSKEKDILLKKKDRDPSNKIAGAFVGGFDDLENRVVTPPYLSEFGMVKAQKMVMLIGRNGASGFSVAAVDKRVEVTTQTAKHINQLLPIKRTAIGSVEGTLEKISVHKRRSFVIYHSRTKRAVTCEIDSEELMELAKENLGERVSVSGVLQKNFKGETMRVRVERMRPLGRIHLIPGVREAWGDPEFTESPNTDEMLRRIRGA
jgi:hypothetical protein